jgi:fumarylacetoacetase
LHLPFSIGDFTDFSCSENHVLNASEVMTKTRAAPPGFYYFPVGYTARTSSIVVSGTPVKRPQGQYKTKEGKVVFGPTNKLDYELEVAAFIGKATELGKPVRVEEAEEHIFGLVLLNDWSGKSCKSRSFYLSNSFPVVQLLLAIRSQSFNLVGQSLTFFNPNGKSSC